MKIGSGLPLLVNMRWALGNRIDEVGALASFKVRVGGESGSGDILSGVLSQQDMDAFKTIVKDVNVLDASHKEMSSMERELYDARLLPMLSANHHISGPTDFKDGKQVNRDVKYNQLQYQKNMLAGMNEDPESHAMSFHAQDIVRNNIKILSAVADASEATGRSISPRVSSSSGSGDFKLELSDFGRKLARGELGEMGKTEIEEIKKKKEMDEVDLKILLLLLKQQAAQEQADAIKAQNAERANAAQDSTQT